MIILQKPILKLREKDKRDLKKVIHETQSHSIRIRAKALLLLGQGYCAEFVALQSGVTVRSIFSWKKRFISNRSVSIDACLSDAYRSGRPKTVSGVIDPCITSLIEDCRKIEPTRSKPLTHQELQHLINVVYGMHVSRNSVALALKRLGLSRKNRKTIK